MARHDTEHRPAVHDVRAEVVASARRGDGFAHLTLHAPAIASAAQPGQFVSVLCPTERRHLGAFDTAEAWAQAYRKSPATAPGSAPLLRRPISTHRATRDGRLELLFKVVGRGTKLLAALGESDRVDVLGPMGHGFDLDGRYDTAVLVAGGAGLAPMPLLAERLHEAGKKIAVIAGAKDVFPMSMSFFSDLGAEVFCASETPRDGVYHGLCTDLLERSLQARAPGGQALRAFSCGPWAMLRVVAALCAQHAVPLQVSLEQRMGCALGACMACVRKVFDDQGHAHHVRVCTEGPVFDAEKVKWDESE